MNITEPANSTCIMTYTGVYFHLPNKKNKTDGPRPFDIRDIAHHLSNLCRYGGACKRFYSVAEHSVYVSQLLMDATDEKIDAKAGLLHDLSEAYLVDIPRDFKALLTSYKKLEELIMHEGIEFFGLPYPYGERIKVADDAVLFNSERLHMFNTTPFGPKKLTAVDIRNLDIWEAAKKITPKFLDPISAEKLFLETYSKLFYPNSSTFGRGIYARNTDALLEKEEEAQV